MPLLMPQPKDFIVDQFCRMILASSLLKQRLRAATAQQRSSLAWIVADCQHAPHREKSQAGLDIGDGFH